MDSSSDEKPIALVIPWFGKQQTGGAEQQAYQLARYFVEAGIALEVLTTCSQSFHKSWEEDYFSPGLSVEEGIKIRRFPLGPRRSERFNQAVGALLSIPEEELRPGISPLAQREEAIYAQEGINAPALLSYIAEQEACYRWFIFLPYLFPLIQQGAALVRAKALLQPCLHKECYAYLHATAELFAQSRHLLFNSRGEYQLARSLYGGWIDEKSTVVGEGIAFVGEEEPEEDSPAYNFPYVLYLGKKCAEKNVPLLIAAFDLLHKDATSELRLVLAGALMLPRKLQRSYVLDLAYVQEGEKTRLLRWCRALLMPSTNESFSRVIYEAWFAGRPVVVHGECLATRGALADSGNAGWHASSPEHWAEVLGIIAALPEEELASLGARGKGYAEHSASWPEVVARYGELFTRLEHENLSMASKHEAALVLLDGVVNPSFFHQQEVANIRKHLRTSGKELVYVQRDSSSQQEDLATANLAMDNPEVCLLYWGDEAWRDGLALLERAQGRSFWRLEGEHSEMLIGESRRFSQLLVRSEGKKKQLLAAGLEKDQLIVLPTFITTAQIPGEALSLPLFKRENGCAVNLLLAEDYRGLPQVEALVAGFRQHWGRRVRLLVAEPCTELFLTQVLLADLLLLIEQEKSQDIIPLSCLYYGVPLLWLRDKEYDCFFAEAAVIAEGKSTAEILQIAQPLVEDSPRRKTAQEKGYAALQEYNVGAQLQLWRKVINF